MQKTQTRNWPDDLLSCWRSLLCVCLLVLLGCSGAHDLNQAPPRIVLTMMPAGDNTKDVDFFQKELAEYFRRTGIRVKVLAAYDSVDTRLRLLQDIFQKKLTEPDICGIDNIWPGLLAEDLIDLRPYVGDELSAFDLPLLDAFTVAGRLVALPETFEIPVMYYRKDLLRKYGYRGPPDTWDELEKMALVIQIGERKSGHTDFWGYIWQGAEGEALTCNAMEWQQGEGANLITKSGGVCAFSPAAEFAVRRGRSWVGKISPPSVIEYEEEDASNFWLAGSAAFARGWPSLNALSNESSKLAGRFGATLVPAGRKGHASTFGGMGLAVSRYSSHPKEAVAVLRYLLSAEVERRRLLATGAIPSRADLIHDSVLLKNSAFSEWAPGRAEKDVFGRPSALTGKKYETVSNAYSKAIHEAISGKVDTHEALTKLQMELETVLAGQTAKRNWETRSQ